MIDFVDEYMRDANAYDDSGFDEQRVISHSLSSVLPLIIEKELTPKQRTCIRLFYVNNKSQAEIARELRVSQPTVSRHISTAKAIINKIIRYCYYTTKKANDQWLKQY